MSLKIAVRSLAVLAIVALAWLAHRVDGLAMLKRLHGG